MKVNALRVGIFENKSIGNCSNNGISSRYDSILLVCADGNIELDADNLPENVCTVCYDDVCGKEYAYIEPVSDPNQGYRGWMFGGCLCYSSDSRFTEISQYPLKLHDRQE